MSEEQERQLRKVIEDYRYAMHAGDNIRRFYTAVDRILNGEG